MNVHVALDLIDLTYHDDDDYSDEDDENNSQGLLDEVVGKKTDLSDTEESKTSSFITEISVGNADSASYCFSEADIPMQDEASMPECTPKDETETPSNIDRKKKSSKMYSILLFLLVTAIIIIAVVTSVLLSGEMLNSVINAFDLFGTGVFAFSGSVMAGKRGMDLLGVMIIATITSVGGGTIRDGLLLNTSGGVFWVGKPIFLGICLVVALTTFLCWPWLEKKFGWRDSAKILCTADALGLAAFAVLGTQKAVDLDLSPLICIVSGLVTATFGGVTRDVLCQENPRILYPHQTIYAAPAIVGSGLYILLVKATGCKQHVAAWISFFTTFTTRFLSIFSPWRLPHWKDTEKSGDRIMRRAESTVFGTTRARGSHGRREEIARSRTGLLPCSFGARAA